jgi:ATP-dependent DNA ligase
MLQQTQLLHVKSVATSLAGSVADVELHFHNYTRHGYEGIMLRPDGRYEFGQHVGRNGNLTQKRSQSLWKYKQWEDGEFTCIDVTDGEGKAAIGIGALVCIADSTKPFVWTGDIHTSQNVFKVGTGLSDEERVEYADKPPIGKLVKSRFLELTDDDVPFNASFLAVLD